MEIIQKQAQKRGIVINMNLPILDRRVYYGFILIGFIALIIGNLLRRKKYGIPFHISIIISFLVEVFSILGAIILFKIENINRSSGLGFSFFGTVIFLPLFMFVFSIIYKKIPYKKLMNYISITIPLELAIIRIGCTICGCCYGILFPFGIHYGEAIRFPVQLMEAILDIGIFMFLLINESKNRIKSNFYIIFIFTYSIIRLLCEFFRDDVNPLFIGLTNGQIFSILILVSLMIYYLIKNKQKLFGTKK